MIDEIYSAVYRSFIYPVYHTIKRDGFAQAQRSAEAAESMDAGALLSLQHKKTTVLLAYAVRNVPFYREIAIDPDNITAEDLQKFPLIDKVAISSNLAAFVDPMYPSRQVVSNSTSGSTGVAFRFFTDRRALAYRAAVKRRNLRWLGVDIGDKVAFLWGAKMDTKRSASLRGKFHQRVTRHLMLSSFAMDMATLKGYSAQLRSFAPSVLITYPGPLEVFTDYCVEKGLIFPSLKGIITSAETLYDNVRLKAESQFGVRVFNRYGCREVGDIAHEDENHDGLLVNIDNIVLEILRNDGSPCAPGEVGELYVTDLENFGMPLIRYRMSDQASWSSSPSRTWKPFPQIRNLQGRSLDIVIGTNGNRVGGTFWTILLKQKSIIRQFQVRQECQDGISIHYVADERMGADDISYFDEQIKKTCGAEFFVNWIPVSEFGLPDSGKHRIIISSLEKIRKNNI